MADILYSDTKYPSGAVCAPCQNCCYRRVEKDPHSAEEIIINWRDVKDLGPTTQVLCVEAAFLTSCNEPVDDCEIGFTHLFDTIPHVGRRSYNGPWTTGRIHGGLEGCAYKLYLRLTYSKCGHKFHKQTCIDVVITNC